eukprot:3226377-Prymnesium_polylepis.1
MPAERRRVEAFNATLEERVCLGESRPHHLTKVDVIKGSVARLDVLDEPTARAPVVLSAVVFILRGEREEVLEPSTDSAVDSKDDTFVIILREVDEAPKAVLVSHIALVVWPTVIFDAGPIVVLVVALVVLVGVTAASPIELKNGES